MTWRILTGVAEYRADEALCDLGRKRFHAERGNVLSRSAAASQQPRLDVCRVVFLAQRSPWRLVEVALDDTADSLPGLVAWSGGFTTVLSTDGGPPAVLAPSAAVGDLGVKFLLDPRALRAILPEPWSGTFHIEGAVLEQDPFLVPEILCLGADSYEGTYDYGLRAITSLTAFLDGRVAQRRSLSEFTQVP